ncbi:MAG: alkylation repair enzyme [Chloroflexota bacterium]|nr:alkylation repair enzyme [Chloroflexota bacterium]
MTSEVSRRAAAFVEERLPQARGLGLELADLIEDPESFTRALTEGLERLVDPAYEAEQERVAPGSGATIGVRWPLIRAVQRALTPALAESSSSSVLWLAQRLSASELREVKLFSLPCLQRSLPDDPERSWQLMRRLGRGARDWITVDSLADVYAAGILNEAFRWAEIEQLVYSEHRMERRLVGSTLARMPYRMAPAARRAAVQSGTSLDARKALDLIAQLIGDADDQVEKALSWAIREWSRVDPRAAEQLLVDETERAVRTDDGHRAWVVRDSLALIDPRVAAELRARLSGVRRRTGGPSTSRASEAARSFAGPEALGALAERVVAHQGERFARRSA